MIDRSNIWFNSYVILMSKQDVWYARKGNSQFCTQIGVNELYIR